MSTPLMLNETTDWGYYVAQHQPRPRAFGLTYEVGFTKPPPDSSLRLTIAPDLPLLITSISGNLSVTGYQAETNASVVAVIYANNADGDVPISWVKVSQIGRGTLVVPVNAVFADPIAANSLTLGWYVDLPGAQTISAGLILSTRPQVNNMRK